MEINGTIIEVRNVFEISAAVSAIYKRQAMAQFDQCMNLLNEYSLILFATTLVVTSGKLIKKNTKLQAGGAIEEKVKCKWQTHGCGDFMQNVKYILQN